MPRARSFRQRMGGANGTVVDGDCADNPMIPGHATAQELIFPPEDLLLYADALLASPYAMSAFVALREKALLFDMETVDLATNANHEPYYAATSLTRRVPTLVHSGFSLSESPAISEYLDEVFRGTPLYPKDARSRAKARQVQA